MDDELSIYFQNHPQHDSKLIYVPSENATTELNEKSHRAPIDDRFDNSTSKIAVTQTDACYKEAYKLRELTVELERCDKIWETLQLIRNMQVGNEKDSNIAEPTTLPKESDESVQDPPGPSVPKIVKKVPSYTEYLPSVNNGNSKLPNLSVKSQKKLFHCDDCGRNYVEFRALRHHAFRVHCVFIPPKRKKASHTNDIPIKFRTNVGKETSALERAKLSERATPSTRRKAMEVQKLRTNSVKNLVSPTVENPPKKNEAKESPALNLIKCSLCSRVCKNIKKHIVEYHKILYPELVVNNCIEKTRLEKTKNLTFIKTEESPNLPHRQKTFYAKAWPRWNDGKFKCLPKPKEENSAEVQPENKPEFKSEIKLEHKPENRRKRCRICLGMYAEKSIPKHVKIHRWKGETRENIHLFKTRYRHSPYYSYNKVKTSQEEEVDEPISNVPRKMRKLSHGSDSQEESTSESRSSSESTDTVCECGRSFRNPHTLYLHKAKCRDEKYTRRATRSSSDRDSGIGISITIKKKNNSYEIVNRDSSEEDKDKAKESKQTTSSPSDVLSANEEEEESDTEAADVDPPDHNKLFEDTSIMKIQTVEDDVEVDIEDEDDSHSSEENSSPIVEDSHLTLKDSKANAPVKEENISKFPTLKELCKQALLTINTTNNFQPKEIRKKDLAMLTPKRRRLEQSCLCGKLFKSEYFLNLHVKKLHPNLLNCGYCKATFVNFIEYQKHDCSEIRNDGFELFQLPCPICGILLDITSYKFDVHTRSQHFDPVVPYQCFICSERFRNASQRRIHFREMHKVSPCSVCNKKLPFEMKIKHELYHQGIGYPCHVCKKAFSQRTFLIKHIETVHDNVGKERTCNICSKVVGMKSWKAHVATHRPRKSCKICGVVTNNFSKLELHIDRKHKNDYPFVKCNFCEMNFIHTELLERHTKSDNCRKFKNTEPDVQIIC